MRIVAGDASECAATLGVAPAEGPAHSLRADPGWVVAVVLTEVSAEDVAVVALLRGDELGRRGRGIRDRHVGETGGDGRQMVPARPVAALAADRPIRRLGAGRSSTGSRVGRVAIQAFGHAVADADRLTLEVVAAGRVDLVENGPVPGPAVGRVVR